MATKSRELSPAWESITSGTENAVIQVRNGVIEWCDYDAIPDVDLVAHTSDNFIVAGPPLKIWVRAVTPGKSGIPGYTRIVVTKWQD